MNYHTAIRLAAMAAVKKPDNDYDVRVIHRWYSKTFHTPLHLVSELDQDDVFQAYWESHYEEMEEERREEEIALLLETPEDLVEADRAWQATEVDSVRYRKLVAAQEAKKKAEGKTDEKVPEKLAGLTRMAPPRHKVPESTLPKPRVKPLPPVQEDSISMKFDGVPGLDQIPSVPSVGPKNPPPPRGKKPLQSR